MKLLQRLALTAVLLHLLPQADATITVQNFYRMGEGLPSGIAINAQDSVGGQTMSAPGGPFYSTDVPAEATARTGSLRSMLFFGTGNYLTRNVSNTATDNFGVECWIKMSSTAVDHALVYNGSPGSNGWGIVQSGGSFKAKIGSTEFGAVSIPANTWTHLALVRASGTATFYVNGTPRGSSTTAPTTPSGVFTIGPRNGEGADSNAINADEVRFFTFGGGQFRFDDLMVRAPDIAIEQPYGTGIATGGTLDYGTVGTTTDRTLEFAVRNTGLSDLLLSGSPRVALSGANAGDFSVTAQPNLPLVDVSNAGFELPSLPVNGWSYGAAATDWTVGSSAGVARNGSPWFVNPTPDGAQAAFIQGNQAGSKISRPVSMPSAGNFLLRFAAVRRGPDYPGNDIEVRVDGAIIGTISNTQQPDDNWRTFTLPYTCPAAGNYALTFTGMRGGGDYGTAIDDVDFIPVATTFSVKFAPGASGARTATLSIPSNDPDESPYTITLKGSAPAAPVVTTGNANSGGLSSQEVVRSTVNPDGISTTVTIEYGTTTAYGSTQAASGSPITTTLNLETTLSGLTPGTLYHYRVVATNASGTGTGQDQTFTTRASDGFTVAAYYRLGENDGPGGTQIAADSVMETIHDSVGGHDLVDPDVSDPVITAAPLFRSSVDARAAAEVGSTRALDFREGRSYASAPLFFAPGGNYVMEAWVKPAATLPNSFGFILFNGDGTFGYGIGQYGDHFAGQWRGGFIEDFGYAPVVIGQWVHLAIVVQNSKATFYVNGVATGTTVRPASAVPSGSTRFWMGKGYHYDFRASGQLDEVRLSTFANGQFSPASMLIKSIPPDVNSPTVTNITPTGATLGGTVTSRGGNPVTERGVVFSKTLENGDPQVGGTGVGKQIASGDYGAFGVAVSGLAPVTQYSYRPYAISTAGTIYGPVATFLTPAAAFTPLTLYRFGEADPGAVAGGAPAQTRDSIGTRHLTLGGTPLYSSAAAPDSTLAIDFGNAAVQATGVTLQPQLTEDFGMEAWAKPTTSTGRHWVFYNGNLNSNGWGIFQDASAYYVYCAGRVQFSGGTVTTNQWTHLAVARTSGVTTLYVNGDAVATSTISPNAPDGNFTVGANPGNPSGERWQGLIDEVRYFAFPAGQFTVGSLLIKKPEIQILQPGGTEIADGGTYSLGPVTAGSPVTAVFTLRNTGNTDLAGLQTTIESPQPADGADFTLDPPTSTPLAPGSSRTFSVGFNPSSAGTKSVVVHITSNDADESPYDITVSGLGMDPEIELQQPVSVPVPSGGSRQFDKLLLGDQQTLSFAIRNNGNVPLNLTGTPRVAITGPNAADFSVAVQPPGSVSPGSSSGPAFFQAGFETPAQSAGGFTYRPAGSGWTIEGAAGLARNASPWFVNNAPEGSQAVFLQSNNSAGAAGTISRSVNFPETGAYLVRFQAVRRAASNAAVDIAVAMDGTTLGTVANGSQPDDTWRTFEIPYLCTAAGDHTLRFSASRGGSGDFGSAIDAVELASRTNFDVTFRPSAHGLRSATLTIASNDRDEGSYQIALSGRGQGNVAELAVEQPPGTPAPSGGSRDLGSVDVGSSAGMVFTLQNTGIVDLLFSGTPPVVIGGANAGDFSVTVQPAAVLPVVAPAPLFTEGFETPALGNGAFSYAPGGTAWTYGSSTGRARNGSPWFVQSATEGEHAAFLQRQANSNPAAATISRGFDFPAAGEYLLSFAAVRRGGGYTGVDIMAKLDGSTIGTVPNASQPDDVWRRFSIPFHCDSPGTHTLSFTGWREENADYASAIDAIRIESTPSFKVQFTPTAAGPRSATLTIPSNDPTSPYTLQLTGTGVQVYTPLESWRLQHFGSAANAGTAADDADPNGNGISNLIEYALGGDPTGNSTGISILPQLAKDGSGHLTYSFSRPTDRPGVTLVIQASNLLDGTWTDLAKSTDGAPFGNFAPGVTVQQTGSGNTRQVILTDSATPATAFTRFLRLKATSP